MTIVLRIFLDREIVKMELGWVVMIMTGSSADIRPILCKSEGVSVVGRDRCRSPGCSWRCQLSSSSLNMQNVIGK